MEKVTYQCTLLSDIILSSNSATEEAQEVLDYIQKKYPDDTDKQFLLLRLDSINSVDNFHRMNRMKLNPSI